MLKLKLQYLRYLMRITDSLEKTMMQKKNEGRRRGQQRLGLLNSIIDSMDLSLSKLLELMDREACSAAVHGVTKNNIQLSNRTLEILYKWTLIHIWTWIRWQVPELQVNAIMDKLFESIGRKMHFRHTSMKTIRGYVCTTWSGIMSTNPFLQWWNLYSPSHVGWT